MKVYIEIDCTDEDEIYAHLTVARKQIKKGFKDYWKKYPEGEAPVAMEVSDNNCYGMHTVVVEEE